MTAVLLRLKALIARVLAYRTALAAVVAMGVKAGGALLTLAIFTLAARAMSGDDFGKLAIWFNALGFLGVAACYGQDTLIARSYGEYAGKGDYANAWGAYRYGWRLTLISGVVFAAALCLIAPYWFPSISRTALLAGSMFLLTQSALHYSSHSSRVVVNFVVSETNRELTWRLLLLAVVIVAVVWQGLTPAEFFAASAIGQLLSLAVQLNYVRQAYRAHPTSELREDHASEWSARARSMWLSAIVEAIGQYADVMLIGYFASPAIAGEYFVAARIANVFLMVLTGLNTYSFSQSANLYFSGQVQKLQDILRALVGVSALLVTPLLMLIYAFGGEVLTIFGERYAHVYPTLSVLSTASYAMCLSGSASVILLTTGHERLYSRVITAATLLRLSITALGAVMFGAFGAACGWAIVNAPLFIALAAICKRVCGVDPSIVSVIRSRQLAPTASGLAPAAPEKAS